MYNLLEVFWKEDFDIYAQSFDFERLPEYLL